MASDPPWIVHRFGETLTVKVGSFLVPAQFRLPAALEPELRTWFRRSRWQGWLTALPLLALAKFIESRMELDVLFVLVLVGVSFGWSILSGNTAERFLRRFPDARPVGQSGQPVHELGGGTIYATNEDGTVDVSGLHASGRGFRIPARDIDKLRPWFRQTRTLAWAIGVPWLVLIFLLYETERFPPEQKTWLTAAIWISGVALMLFLAKAQFRRFFPDAQRLPGRKGFLATQAEHPFYPAHMLPLLIGSLLLDALVIWGVWIKQEVAAGDSVLLVCVLGASAYLLTIVAYQFRSRTRRTSAPD